MSTGASALPWIGGPADPSDVHAPRSVPTRERRRSRLSPRARKALMVVHLIGSLGLLGADAAVLVLGIAGATGSDPRTVYPAARLVGTVLLVPLAFVALGTGVLQGLLTPWGLVRHWWVTIKFGLTLAGTVLALVVLTPALRSAADAAVAGSAPAAPWELVRDAASASSVLVTTVLLSVFKPFGRVRRRRS